MDAAVRLHRDTGVPEGAQRWQDLQQRLVSLVREHAWDPAAGLFRPGIGRNGDRFCQHAQAGAINAGVATAEPMRRIVPRLSTDSTLIRANSMQGFYVARALERAGAVAQWHRYALDQWRAFLTQHVTTWPEYPDPSRSDSHAWGAWPAVVYVTTVLGVRPLAPGWIGVRLAPHVDGLTWAKGNAPSPAGLIKVEWNNQGGVLRFRAEVPKGLPAEVALPGTEVQDFPPGGTIALDLERVEKEPLPVA